MPRIRFIYFDLGDVLIDYSGCFTEIAKIYDLDQDALTKFYRRNGKALNVGEISLDEFWDKCGAELGIPKTKLIADYDWLREYKPMKATYSLIKNYLVFRYSIGIISNVHLKELDGIIKNRVIPDIEYRAVILSAVEKLRKPGKEIYTLAQKKSGVSSEEILLVDDNKENLDAAEELGWRVFHFDKSLPKKSCQELKKFCKR